MQTITPCLWSNGHDLREMADYYLRVFDGTVTGGTEHSLQLDLDGSSFTLIQGGDHHFAPNESVSFALALPDQAAVDRYWAHFAEEGRPGPCGWIADRYGFAWQVVPSRLFEMLQSEDHAAVARVTACFMQVDGRAFDIGELEAAYAGR